MSRRRFTIIACVVAVTGLVAAGAGVFANTDDAQSAVPTPSTLDGFNPTVAAQLAMSGREHGIALNALEHRTVRTPSGVRTGLVFGVRDGEDVVSFAGSGASTTFASLTKLFGERQFFVTLYQAGPQGRPAESSLFLLARAAVSHVTVVAADGSTVEPQLLASPASGVRYALVVAGDPAKAPVTVTARDIAGNLLAERSLR